MKQASEQTESIDSDGVQIEDLGSNTDDSSEEFDDLDIDEGDLLNLDAVQRMVEDMTWKLVQITAPDWYLNPSFKVLFDTRSAYDSIAACSPLEFPPDMQDVLTRSEPPGISFFKSLPKPVCKVWAIYGITMEKFGCNPKLYVGSGTDATLGVSDRLKNYGPGHAMLPRLVREAFRQGYHISHQGPLCWTPLPSAGLVPRVRARFLLLEAIFTCLFHASRASTSDVLYQDVLLWERQTVEWEPLGTHLPLREKILGNLDLSPDKLEIIAHLRKEHDAKRISQWRLAKKAKDPDAFRAHGRVQKNAWAAKHRDKVNKTAKKVKTKAKTEQRFYCGVCEMPLQSQAALDKHLASESHANRAAGTEKSETSQYSINRKTKRAKAKAKGKHHCHTCNKGFGTEWDLNRHKNTPSHKKAAREAQASQ